MYDNIAVIGSSGAIGGQYVEQLSQTYPNAHITSFSRTEALTHRENVKHCLIDYSDESSICDAAKRSASGQPLDLVLVATGVLHNEDFQPEKSLSNITATNLQALFLANTVLPALAAKYFIPKLNRSRRSFFAALSARVGSISDNRLGGWYGYRASKAALNMIIKNAAIETARKNKQAVIVGLHPGTVDSNLSKPFQGNVPEGKLFTPEYSVKQQLAVLNQLTPEQSGKCFAWDGSEIHP